MTLLGTVYSPRQEQFAASPADIIAIALAPLSRPPPLPPLPHGEEITEVRVEACYKVTVPWGKGEKGGLPSKLCSPRR